MVDKFITDCSGKARMLKSEKKNRKAYGLKYRSRAEFFRANRDLLIERMVERDLPPKKHKIKRFMMEQYNRIRHNAGCSIRRGKWCRMGKYRG